MDDPGASEHAAYARLVQIRWDSRMHRCGNYGGHKGWASRRRVAATLAPIVAGWAEGIETAAQEP